MLEHQHVNMFTHESIMKILGAAGFGGIEVTGGSYGNTFQVYAVKGGDTEGAVDQQLRRAIGDAAR